MVSMVNRITSRFIGRDNHDGESTQNNQIDKSNEKDKSDSSKSKLKRDKHDHHGRNSNKIARTESQSRKNDDEPIADEPAASVDPEISRQQDFRGDGSVDAAVYQLVSASLGQDAKRHRAGNSGTRGTDDNEMNDWTGQPWDNYLNTEGMADHTTQGNQDYSYYGSSVSTGGGSRSKKHKRNAQSSNVDPALAHLDETTTTTTQNYDLEEAVRQARSIRAEVDGATEGSAEDTEHYETNEPRGPNAGSETSSIASGYTNGLTVGTSRVPGDRRVSWKGDGTETAGTFKSKEAEALEFFMEGYRKEHNWTRDEFTQRVWATERLKDSFWDDVAAVLPHRTRASIYKHVRRVYHVFEARGKWTKEEDARLGELVNRKGSQWKLIGLDMERMPEDCRDRWRNYVKCGENRKSNKWDADEEDQLKRIVTKMIHDDPNGEVNWTLVSENMGGTRSRIQCRYKWNKLSKKGQGDMSNKENHRAIIRSGLNQSETVQLLEILRSHSESQGQDVDWDGIARLMPDPERYSGSELRISFDKLKRKVNGYRTKSFNQLVLDILENELRGNEGR